MTLDNININKNELSNIQLNRLNMFKIILDNIDTNKFILKGGTALLLFYGLDRFSEDIDLDALTNTMNICKYIKNYDWNTTIKKDTPTVFKAMIDYGDKKDIGNYSLKIEISSRNKNLLNQNILKYANIDGINVYTLEELMKMKINAFANRDKIRDFYDISYYLTNNPEVFSDDMLLTIKNILDYKNLDELESLLDIEFKEHNLKKMDSEYFVLNTYNTVENLILDRDIINKQQIVSDFVLSLDNNPYIKYDEIPYIIQCQNILDSYGKSNIDTNILFANITKYIKNNYTSNQIEYILNNSPKNYDKFYKDYKNDINIDSKIIKGE